MKILPLGSDFPIEGVNPLLGFYAAFHGYRSTANLHMVLADGEWVIPPDLAGLNIGFSFRYPEQRLTRAQALKGMTLDAAYASFAEKDLGSLTPGKKGKYVSLSASLRQLTSL